MFAIILLAGLLVGAGVVASAAAQASTPPAPLRRGSWCGATSSTALTAPRSTLRNGSPKPAAEAGATTNLSTTRSASTTPSQQDGNLVIKVLQEKYTGADGVTRNYTSARLKTLGKFSQTYGRFEARIKIPRGQGIWPAFWMLGDDIDKPASNKSGWPDCGEIDIMENIGKEPALVHGTIHGPGYSGEHGIGAPYALPGDRPGNSSFADDFHIFAVEWEPNTIRFYVDDHLYATRTPADLPEGAKWVYDHPFFILLNVAVGGDWPGNPDATSVFPQTMLVDYVRVYEPANSPAARPAQH